MLRACILVSLFFCAAATASGQAVGASLQGAVTDPTGAAVPNARVELRNPDTAAIFHAVTDGAGRFREPLLPPGSYGVRISADGFQSVLEKGLRLSVGQDAVLDTTLQLGKQQER